MNLSRSVSLPRIFKQQEPWKGQSQEFNALLVFWSSRHKDTGRTTGYEMQSAYSQYNIAPP